MPKISDEHEQLIVDSYKRGLDVREIASLHSTVVQTVYNILDRNNVERRAAKSARAKDALVVAVRRGAPIAKTAHALGISDRTARRALKGRSRSTPSTNSVLEKLATVTSEEEAFQILRCVAFPYPQPLSAQDIAAEVRRVKAVRVYLDDDTIRPQSHVGTRLCAPFFPNRYDAAWKSTISARASWDDDHALRRAIRFQLAHGDPVLPHRVLRAITLRSRTPTIFRPAVARFLCETYCPPGGMVWDPCSGYGGRLLGAFAAGVRYIGTDVDAATVDGNQRLARAIGADADVHCTPAETFESPRINLVLTSPPYFDRERYSEDENQSWKKYGSRLDAWIAGFVRPVVKKAALALQNGGYLILNVADLREKGKVIPVVEGVLGAVAQTNLSLVKMLKMPIAAINRKAPSEPVLVFRKPL